MAELRISDLLSGPNGQRRVEVTWRDGPVPREAIAEFTDVPDAGDGERIRWYLGGLRRVPRRSCAGDRAGVRRRPVRVPAGRPLPGPGRHRGPPRSGRRPGPADRRDPGRVAGLGRAGGLRVRAASPAAPGAACRAGDPSGRFGRRGGGDGGAAPAGCGVLRPRRDIAGAGPDVRWPACRPSARLRRGGQVLYRGGVRPLVPGHRRPESPRLARHRVVVLVRAPPDRRPGHRHGRRSLRWAARGQRHPVGGAYRPSAAPGHRPAGACAVASAVGVGQR